MKLKFALLLLLIITNNHVFADDTHSVDTKVTSPDGKIEVIVNINNGTPTYNVNYDGKPFLLSSPLGLVTDLADYTCGLTLSEVPKMEVVSDSYSLLNIKRSHVEYNANQLTCAMMKDGKPAIDIIFRVSNCDVAFKYRIYPVGDKQSCVVKEEKTGFVLPSGTTTFLCPQSEPMRGFAGTSPSYETSYTLDDSIGKNGWGQGYTFPCLFRNNDYGWLLISETGVDANYCASRIIGHQDGRYTIGFPQKGEMNGLGCVTPGIACPGDTPWRTITLGNSLKPIVETTVPFDLVKPKYEASQHYEYGKGVWSWIIQMDNYTVFDEQKRYIDFASAMGYKSILIDALWDTQIGRERIAELSRYGAKKGVAIYLWYNSNGHWNYAPQGPRGIMDNSIARHREMKWMKSIGIRGIKVDFFGGDKQDMMKLYEDILTDANDYGIMVIFHGCTLPRGWERMYPNFVASEAVLASENLHFSQQSCDNEAINGCIHPFIRNTVGSMDFGGSALNKRYSRDNMHGNIRRTSDVYALATAVLFQSAAQHFALAPNNLDDAPSWAIDFMRSVPTTWDDVSFVDGYPGRDVILARRHGNQWYVAGINAQDNSYVKNIYLPMFSAGQQVRIYSDNKSLVGSVKIGTIGKDKTLKVVIPKNGGIVITASNI